MYDQKADADTVSSGEWAPHAWFSEEVMNYEIWRWNFKWSNSSNYVPVLPKYNWLGFKM